MTAFLDTFQIGSSRQSREGLRIATVRFLPRGVPKSKYATLDYFDVWLPTLAPSRDLLSKFKQGEMSIETFFKRFRAEMNQTDPKQTIELLAQLATRTLISIGCYCDDESRCHRSILVELIEGAGHRS
jgi:uncharacterized protein YeaO (DUF488 family)